MKEKFKIFGIIAVALVIMFTMTACGEDEEFEWNIVITAANITIQNRSETIEITGIELYESLTSGGKQKDAWEPNPDNMPVKPGHNFVLSNNVEGHFTIKLIASNGNVAWFPGENVFFEGTKAYP